MLDKKTTMATLRGSNKENIESMEVELEQKKELPKQKTKKHDEVQYLELIRKILETGIIKGDRTGM